VHLQWWSLPLAPVYLVILALLKIRKKTVLLTVHNVVPHEKRLMNRWLSWAIFLFADHFVVHTENNRQRLSQLFSISAERIEVIHHPVLDIYQAPSESQASIRRRLEIPSDAATILFFGNIRHYKGLDILIRALPEILKAVPKAHLVVAGQSWEDWDMTYGQLVRSLGVSGSVTAYSDYVPTSDVGRFFSASDIVVLPYRNFEAQSGVGNIALAFAAPLIVTNVGGLGELVEDPRAICPPNDSEALAKVVKTVLLDSEWRAKLISDAKKLKERYSWKNAAKRTIDLYRQLSKRDG